MMEVGKVRVIKMPFFFFFKAVGQGFLDKVTFKHRPKGILGADFV